MSWCVGVGVLTAGAQGAQRFTRRIQMWNKHQQLEYYMGLFCGLCVHFLSGFSAVKKSGYALGHSHVPSTMSNGWTSNNEEREIRRLQKIVQLSIL